MKGKSDISVRMRDKIGLMDPEILAIRVLDCLISDPERLGRFLAMTGLDPSTIRGSAANPGFLAAIMDHVVGDEGLLVAVASEAELDPREIAAAQARLSPEPDWEL